uniref:Condensin complex subunit 2 n=2 Tax=Homalodisca liturata TaxID=320908 RepID=A0A1B6JEM2_9HEMI
MNSKRIPTINNSLMPSVVLKRVKINTPSELLSGNHIPSIADEEEDEIPQEAVGRQLHTKPTDYTTLLNLEDAYMHTMTKEELNEHIQKCLEMSSEDKITSKNAFALRLIDCMGVLLQRQTDFSAIACTLDAGTKIYSYRVDALHKQVSKLADEVLLYHKKKQTENDEDTDKRREKNECSVNKERRKLNKKTMIVSSDTLKRKLKGKDPKDNFIKIEPIPGALLSKARRDPKTLHLTLENNVQYWPIKRDYIPLKAEGTLSLPMVKVFRKEMKEIDHQSVLSDSVNNLDAMSENNEVDITDDIQMSPKEIHGASDFEDDTQQDIHCQYEGGKKLDEGYDIVATAIHRINEKMELIGNGLSQFEALKLLFKEADDYNYLDTKNVYYWAGPEFWKRPTRVVENRKTKCNLPKKKKMPKEISYDITVSEVNEKWNKSIKKRQCSKKTVLSDRTKKGWKNKKLIIPKDLDIEVKELIELFHISRHCGQEQTRSNSFSFVGVSTDQDKNIESNCLNDNNSEISNYSDPLNSSFYEGPQVGHSDNSEVKDPLNSAFYDVGLLHSPGFQKQIHTGGDNDNKNLITVEMLADDSSTFDEGSLVPAPKLVNYQPITYSARPIQVNMLHLKDSILTIIDQEIKKNVGTFGPETKFSDILQKLPSVLEKKTAEDVSPAIAFVALLTLANEHSLDLLGCENFSDIVVKQENNTHF